MAHFLLIFLLLSVHSSEAKSPPKDAPTTIEMKMLEDNQAVPDEHAGKPEMNGIRFSDHKDFWNWKLVTVRYRRDLEESRFVYANDKAWKTLESGKIDYPDGSMFVKVGYFSQEDPAFASSAVPAGLTRFQMMLKDKKRYKTTDGWGYAIFNPSGLTQSGSPANQVEACAACHRIVADRGYVFAQKMRREPFAPGAWATSLKNQDAGMKAVQFKKLPVTDFKTRTIRRALKDFHTVQYAISDLRKYRFSGIFNEMLPILLKETKRSALPAVLVSDDENSYAIAMPTDDVPCGSNQKPYRVSWTRAIVKSHQLNVVRHHNTETYIICQ